MIWVIGLFLDTINEINLIMPKMLIWIIGYLFYLQKKIKVTPEAETILLMCPVKTLINQTVMFTWITRDRKTQDKTSRVNNNAIWHENFGPKLTLK